MHKLSIFFCCQANYCSVHLQAINIRDPSRTLRAISSNMGIESREVKFYERWLYIALGANRRSCTPGDLPCHLPRSCCAYCSVGFSVHTAPRNAIRPIAHSGQFPIGRLSCHSKAERRRCVGGWIFQIPAFHKAHSIYNDRDIARDTSRHKPTFKTKVKKNSYRYVKKRISYGRPGLESRSSWCP